MIRASGAGGGSEIPSVIHRQNDTDLKPRTIQNDYNPAAAPPLKPVRVHDRLVAGQDRLGPNLHGLLSP